jgi:hypothetical protein
VAVELRDLFVELVALGDVPLEIALARAIDGVHEADDVLHAHREGADEMRLHAGQVDDHVRLHDRHRKAEAANPIRRIVLADLQPLHRIVFEDHELGAGVRRRGRDAVALEVAHGVRIAPERAIADDDLARAMIARPAGHHLDELRIGRVGVRVAGVGVYLEVDHVSALDERQPVATNGERQRILDGLLVARATADADQERLLFGAFALRDLLRAATRDQRGTGSGDELTAAELVCEILVRENARANRLGHRRVS